jgi:uncharacterized MAPEG superfamily protein
MTPEFLALFVSAGLLLGLPLIYGAARTRELGIGPILGNREDFPKARGWAGRAQRARLNLLENLVPFAIAVFLLRFPAVSNWWTVTGSYLFLGARLVHALTYIAGIPGPRTLAYHAGLLGTLMAGSQCL